MADGTQPGLDPRLDSGLDCGLDLVLDLVLGSRCVTCQRPGRALCAACAAGLPRDGQVAWPSPCPPGLAPPFAAGPYDGALKLLVSAHKEQRVLSLARPLGAVLAGAVEALQTVTGAAPVLLVPVPSRSSVVRRRGHDPVLRTTRCAAAALRRRGTAARVAPLLRHARPVADQAGLGATDRALNLAGALRAGSPRRGPKQAWPAARTVVVDDVLTSGATAREAQRALEAAGWPVAGIAVLCATPRRLLYRPALSLPGAAH